MHLSSSPALTYRRISFGLLVILSLIGLVSLMVLALSPGGFNFLKVLLLIFFSITLPWLVVGFWHAIIGLAIMLFSRDAAALTCPLDPDNDRDPLPKRATALLSCIRNENVGEVERKLDAMLSGLASLKALDGFQLYVLSDTNDAEIAQEEEQAFSALRARWQHEVEVIYRRRENNVGYKSGNIADFCARWGASHTYGITLDADSYLSAETLVALVRKMEANPQLGILQTLAVGLPSKALFARVFQWGMRLGMRSYTLAAAWWQADTGPYWGHNAILRLLPFREHCMLPQLSGKGPLSGHILSHDQVEAAFMRRAGFEVRVWPVEDGSYEENPPNLIEFVRRDLRWCHGNLQYLKLLATPGLHFISRIQLVLAILMFVGSVAWMAFIGVSVYASLLADPGAIQFDANYGFPLFLTVMTMVFSPKLSSLAYVLLSSQRRAGFGGTLRIFVSAICEILFTVLLAPIMAITHTLFIAMLFMGAKVGWRRQERLPKGVSWEMAIRKYWPQFVFGCLGLWWASLFPLSMWWLFAPLVAGPLMVIPFTVMTSLPYLGQVADHYGFWRLPEERQAPKEFLFLEDGALATRELTATDPAVLPR
ncbi:MULTISPECIES: glucans biosynthesis glucosyltransferase MdoH [Pseudovibrio]|uniref:glucans biosynthesis glucosyltransferase MdoH n=1 Tax=Stappiaceae TaxID=2821832 RepID=UPI002366F837|nr:MULTISPECIES: glucans biosynthesis glucosyltransferase MdoH [Pseudovibrio]MDD7909904.1 glucans biosynthesis glucosyltransferase MdoH [Pseudovibrio exalbescens]MDX5592241.1 glucans biosynthesis glucosyltransferase MdoH [Pseudovibrio sp. SPO723]